MTTWTHPSVLAIASQGDPVSQIVDRARSLVFDALDKGWQGPPFDPIDLARILGIAVVPQDGIRDARLIADSDGPRIEFNPNQPRSRTKYSIAHEIAHTLFPDYREQVRYRLAAEERVRDDWQLEMLCNVAASELLMPAGRFPLPSEAELTIDSVLALRKQYEVSLEAVLLRIVAISRTPCAAFAAPNVCTQPCRASFIDSTARLQPRLDVLRTSAVFTTRRRSLQS